VNDGDPSTYWATDDDVTSGAIELTWIHPVAFDRIVLQEAIALGQRVEAWTAEVEQDGVWRQVAAGTTIGHKGIATFAPVRASRLRVRVTNARACPTISTIGVYLAPSR
jgi:alpha-L-fucosidase